MTLKAPVQPVQLLVEGKVSEGFFNSFIEHVGRADIEVRDFGGVNQLRSYLKALVNAPGFDSVTSVAVVRDAETNAQGAFESARSALTAASLVAPNVVGARQIGDPSTHVFILPDGVSAGMLETLCLDAVQNDPSIRCIERLIQCAVDSGSRPPRNPTKAKVLAFLATREDHCSSVSVAAAKGYWPWNSESFGPLKEFIENL